MTDERRWETLQACLLTITSGGTVYSFGAYSNALKRQLQLSQTQITLAAFFSNLGNYIGTSGFIGDRYGMRFSASLGTILIGLGYGGLWVVTHLGKTGSSAAILVTMCCFVWGHGSGYLDSAAIATAAKLFPSERGSVVGLLKSLYGLASSLVVTAVAPLVGQLTFIGVLALVAVSLPALAMGGLEQRPSTNLNAAIEAGRIAGFAKRIVALATALVLVAVVKVARPWHNLAADICVSIGVALGLAAATTPRLMVKSAAERPLMRVSYVSAAGSRDATPGDAVRSLELWLLSGCVLPVAGCGLMTINNLGQIISSRGAGVATQDVGVALVSVANCLGRLSAGVASDGLANRGLPRPLLLCLSAAIACVAMLVLYASGTSITFCLIGVVLAGFSYGMLWTLMPTLIADFFGFRRLASNYMLCLPSVILASLIFSTLLASMVYARHASNSDDDDDEDKCLGASCFGTTFLVTAACCAVASISAAGLTFKTRVLYYRKAAPLVTSEDGVDNPLTAS